MVSGYVTQRVVSGDSATGGDVAKQSGTYYVRVQTVEETLSEPTDYELTVETDELDQYDPNEQPETATRIEPDATISGVLSGSDRDTYAIDLEKGKTITVTAPREARPSMYLVRPNASDATLDPYYDPDYALEHESIEDGFTYTARTTGTHFLRINTHMGSSTINTFRYTSSYEVSVDVSGSNKDDDSDSTDEATETPTQTATSTPSKRTLQSRMDTVTLLHLPQPSRTPNLRRTLQLKRSLLPRHFDPIDSNRSSDHNRVRRARNYI